MYDHLYNKQIYYAYFVWMLWLISLCIAYYVCCTQQKHPSTPIEMESNLCINENPLHQLAHTHKTIRMTNGTQILYKMFRMHYYSKMLVDNGAAWVHFPFDHWVHWNIMWHWHSSTCIRIVWCICVQLLCVACRLNGDVVTIWQTR